MAKQLNAVEPSNPKSSSSYGWSCLNPLPIALCSSGAGKGFHVWREMIFHNGSRAEKAVVDMGEQPSVIQQVFRTGEQFGASEPVR